MEINIKEIADGFYNLLKDKLNILGPELKEKAEKRYLECSVCEMRNGNTCDPSRCLPHIVTNDVRCGCGCRLNAKVLSMESSCPIGKW
jgi:hypothetical protein